MKHGRVYRVYSPYHGLFNSGTTEFGIYTDIASAREQLRSLAGRLAELRQATICWRSEDTFMAVMDSEIGRVRMGYHIREYALNAIICEQVPGWSCGEEVCGG